MIRNELKKQKKLLIAFGIVYIIVSWFVLGAAVSAITNTNDTTIIKEQPKINQIQKEIIKIETKKTNNLVLPQNLDFIALAKSQYGKCGEYYMIAIESGWTNADWPTLSKIIYRESRCTSKAYNKSDPNGGSRGLTQINGFWCRPNKYSKLGFLQENKILTKCDELYNPVINLKAARAIFMYNHVKGRCGWSPWVLKC
jgi:hypothetical protein